MEISTNISCWYDRGRHRVWPKGRADGPGEQLWMLIPHVIPRLEASWPRSLFLSWALPRGGSIVLLHGKMTGAVPDGDVGQSCPPPWLGEAAKVREVAGPTWSLTHSPTGASLGGTLMPSTCPFERQSPGLGGVIMSQLSPLAWSQMTLMWVLDQLPPSSVTLWNSLHFSGLIYKMWVIIESNSQGSCEGS